MVNHPLTTSQPPVPRNTPGSITLSAIPTPTHGSGSFSIIASKRIAAPPHIAFATLLEHTAWPAWNRFVRRATILSAPAPSSSDSSDSPEAPSSASALEAAIASDDGSRYIKQGTTMTFEVHMDPDNAHKSISQDMEVTLLEPLRDDATRPPRGWRVAWKGTTVPQLMLRSERVQEFFDDGEGGTEYTCWETMSGPLAPFIRWTLGKSLEKGFEAWAVDLKARAEEAANKGRVQDVAAPRGA